MSGGIQSVATAIVGAQKAWARKPADFYPTPYDVTQALLDYLRLQQNQKQKQTEFTDLLG